MLTLDFINYTKYKTRDLTVKPLKTKSQNVIPPCGQNKIFATKEQSYFKIITLFWASYDLQKVCEHFKFYNTKVK